MDLYRYFHPHHNPRLRKTPLRLQEMAELQQAAIELTRALKRAHLRELRCQESGEEPESTRFQKAIEAANLLVSELCTITETLPDDNLSMMQQLLAERRDAPGWETWRELLAQRLLLEDAEKELLLPKAKP